MMVQPKNKFYKKFWWRLLIIACIVFSVFILARLFAPPLMSDTTFSHAYYDRHGTLLRLTLSPDDKYRVYVPLDEISPYLQRATILYEDKYFYYHFGINPVALTRSVINYINGNHDTAGASTITMQVARLKYGLNTHSLGGKLVQIAAAIYIDAIYSKRDILAAYLNLAPYGGNIEGIAAASMIYFHKSPKDLSQIEAITLATIPQNPTKRNLSTDTGLQNMRQMRGDLIRRWIDANPDDTQLATLGDMPLVAHNARELPFYAPHFITSQLHRDKNYWRGAQSSIVKTTLDLELQKKLEQRLHNEIARRKNIGVKNAAAILLNYKTMETLAYIGSENYFDTEIFGENDGVRAHRSPGSTLKPLIYAAAVDMGLIHGMTLLKDAKINFGVYAPENADNEFYGPVLARDALTHSRNIPAINLVRQIGVKNFYNLLESFHIQNLRDVGHYGISIALGGAEVSMLELADIYSTMANLGEHKNIKMRIDDACNASEQILSPEAFFLVLDMLARQSTPGQRVQYAKNQPRNIIHYWKTGTSSSYRDAWTAGIFGDYVLIVWIGNFDGTPNNAFSGARTAAPIYFALSDTVAQHYTIKNNNFLRDDMNISEIDMCDRVGSIADANCPKRVKSYFIPGKSPIDTSRVYRAVPIYIRTGLRACTRNPKTTKMVVYEFWDSEYLDMFRRAGITRNTPPPFMPDCDLSEIAQTRANTIITSPIDGTKIVIVSDQDSENVSFQAITDNRNAKIFWFLDGNMIGKTISGQILTHDVKMGEHNIRAVDEMGAAQSADFSVIK